MVNETLTRQRRGLYVGRAPASRPSWALRRTRACDPKCESQIFLFGSDWPCQPSLSWSRNHPKPDIARGDHRLAGIAHIRGLGLSCEHSQGLSTNNLAENSHQPVRRREHKLQRFKSPGSAQRFLTLHSAVHNHFNVQRHLIPRCALRLYRSEAFEQWRRVDTSV